MKYNKRDNSVQTEFEESNKGEADEENAHKRNHSCKWY